MFQANTNASLKNLKTRVGQLAMNMQNQSRDSFSSDDTKKNRKVCMEITLRSGIEKEKKNQTKKESNKKLAETTSRIVQN